MKEQGMNDKDEYLHYIEMIPNLYPESFLWDVDVRSGYECWKCHKTMDIMLFFNPELENVFRDGYPIVSALVHCKPETIIPFALQLGIPMESRYSKTIGQKCVMHVCPSCKIHQGDYHVADDNHQVTDLKFRFKIRFDKQSNSWIKVT
jgi:hypothetical protein